ncbi:sliding clamp [uncultured Caudovirales phage]|uniref:Sliding clamp n=1 Tax=uncultured Caudovirales phage TaxID=2100421 RepID=A0A6J5KXR5_9CAUD|nr:sliding clamp [uncultured Caudovirales phage]
MKISKDTITILKNYASINSNLLLKPGNKLKTTSTNKTIASSVTVAEEFPVEFGIYDLNAFLGALSLFENPELAFEEKFVTIFEKANKVKYFAAEASILVTPKSDIVFPAADITFDLPEGVFNTIQRTAGVLKASDLSVTGDGNSIILTVGDKKNATSNSYETAVGLTDKVFKANIKIENLKMLQSTYKVTIHSKIARFESTIGDLVYYTAIEADSSF